MRPTVWISAGYTVELSIIPPPRHTSPSYSTADWPGVTAHCGCGKSRWKLPLACGARAQGASQLEIALLHGARNAALPAITVLFASLGELFGGSVLAEQVFAYPGLGSATVEAGTRGDVPLLLALALFLTVFVFIGNSIADLLYRVVDPRMHGEPAR